MQNNGYDEAYGFQFFMGLSFVYWFDFCISLTSNYISQHEFLLSYRIIVKLKDPQKRLVNKLGQDFLTTSKMFVEKEIVFSIQKKSYDELQAFNERTFREISPDACNLTSCIIFTYNRTLYGGEHGGRTLILDHFSISFGSLLLVVLLH